MKKIVLFGKKYTDTIMFVDGVKNYETNICKRIIKKDGGLCNFFEGNVSNFKITSYQVGSKKAYIVSDTKNSFRTSYVLNETDSTITKNIISTINEKNDWLHVCYIDDIECYKKLLKIKIPFSIDFCTDKNRMPFLQVMKKAKIVFDSRERKHLYSSLTVDTPIIFHDDNGIEVIHNNQTIYTEKIRSLKNLNVNGAGDIFAANFISKYNNNNLEESASYAMTETTKILSQRNKNE